jgi:hypothetical protein
MTDQQHRNLRYKLSARVLRKATGTNTATAKVVDRIMLIRSNSDVKRQMLR